MSKLLRFYTTVFELQPSEVLLRLTARLLGAGKLNEQQVHAGTTEAEILDALDAAEDDARKRHEGRKNGSVEQMVVQFWDEINACPHQPLFKKILIDRINPRSGQEIHNGLRFVAACNPWRRATRGIVGAVGFESPASPHDRLGGLAYRVYPPAESLFGCLSSFGQLDSNTEAQYVKAMALQPPQLLNPDDEPLATPPLSEDICGIAASCVRAAHHFFREFGSCVSLRDASRLFKLWGFIRWEMEQRSCKPHLCGFREISVEQREFVSFVLALHLSYEVTQRIMQPQ